MLPQTNELHRLYEEMLFHYHEWSGKTVEVFSKDEIFFRRKEWELYVRARDRWLGAVAKARQAELH